MFNKYLLNNCPVPGTVLSIGMKLSKPLLSWSLNYNGDYRQKRKYINLKVFGKEKFRKRKQVMRKVSLL